MPDSSSITLDSVRVLFEKGTYFGNDSIFALPGRGMPGVEGLLQPYSTRQDLAVTMVMVAAFLLMCLILSNGRVYVRQQLKYFFSERKRHNMFSEAGSEFRFLGAMVVPFSLVISVMLFDLHFRHCFPPYLISSWSILGLGTLGALSYYGVKFALYRFVNWVFFDRTKTDRWNEILTIIISLQEIVLFLLTCLSVYYGLNAKTVSLITFLVIILVRILLFYKGKSIFFTNFRGLFYNILYLCTLEMTPLVILWKVIREIG